MATELVTLEEAAQMRQRYVNRNPPDTTLDEDFQEAVNHVLAKRDVPRFTGFDGIEATNGE